MPHPPRVSIARIAAPPNVHAEKDAPALPTLLGKEDVMALFDKKMKVSAKIGGQADAEAGAGPTWVKEHAPSFVNNPSSLYGTLSDGKSGSGKDEILPMTRKHTQFSQSSGSTSYKPMVAVDSSTSTDISFDGLMERVATNKLKDVDINLASLSDEQRKQLVLRGAKLSTVLARMGRRFQDSKGDPKDFLLSKPVDFIQDFLSHSWATKRWVKTLALLYHYNFTMAITAYFIAGATTFALTAWVGSNFGLNGTQPFQNSSAVVMLGVPFVTFCIFLLFGNNLRCSSIQPTVFLDKLCIHQECQDMKLLGIQQLEMFVRHSRQMVVLYDTMTYERLWCVFESAMFAAARGCRTDDLKFVPVHLALFVVSVTMAMMCGPLAAALVFSVLDAPPAQSWFALCTEEALAIAIGNYMYAPMPAILCTCGLVYFPVGYLIRLRCEDMQRLRRTLLDFQVANTKCVDETDRPVVYRRIRATWGSLDNFDMFVRDHVSSLVAKNMGSPDFVPYSALVGMGMPFWWFITWAGLNSPGYPLPMYILGALTYAAVGCPLAVVWWHRIGCVIFKLFPVMRGTGVVVTAFACFINCLVHNYVHNSVLWLSFRYVASWGMSPYYGILLFAPFFMVEIGFLLHVTKPSGENATLGLRKWTWLDTTYFLIMGSVLVLVFAHFLWEQQRELHDHM